MPNTIQINVKVNGDVAVAELKALESEAKSSGSRTGKNYSDNFSKSMSNLGEKLKSSLLPVLASLGTVAAGPLAGIAAGVGAFSALAVPELSKVETALTTTGTAGKKAWDQLTPGEKTLGNDLKGLTTTFHGVQAALQPVIDKVAGLAVKLATDLMPALQTLGGAGGKILESFLGPLDQMTRSQAFSQFVSMLAKFGVEASKSLGPTLVKVLEELMNVFTAMAPAGLEIVKVLGQFLVLIAPLTPMILGLVAGFKLYQVAVAAVEVATKGWAVVQALINGEMDANPIGIVVVAVAALSVALYEAWQHSQTFRNIVTSVFSDVGKAVLTFAEMFLTETQAIANVFLTTVGVIIHGAADAFGWIPGVGGKLKGAAAAFDGFKQTVNDTFNNAHKNIEGWKQDLNNMPKKVKLEGDISDLTSKLNSAKAQLKDPNLTATRKAQIEANIAQLQAQLRTATAQLDKLNGKTVTTYVMTVATNPYPGGISGRKEAGGTVGAAATGGARSGLTMVGEHGREMVRLPAGSTVHSNPDTERMMGGGGNMHITLDFGPNFQQATGLSQQQLEQLRFTVRTVGGGDVQRALGK